MFSPSLVLGAMIGSGFGLIAAGMFPDLGSDPSVYALLGMGALAACKLGAPISTVIMISS
jgi:chloride channel protein, CIC family